MITQGKSNLLVPLGKQRLSKQNAEKILSFMQTIMNPGKRDEDFVETRICKYTNIRKARAAALYYYLTNTMQKSNSISELMQLCFVTQIQ